MTQYEMTEMISQKCDVTLEEARTALEAGGWNVLTATHLLEQEKFRRMQELNEVAASGEAMATMAAPEEEGTVEGAAFEEAQVEFADEGQAATDSANESARGESGKRRDSRGLRNVGEHIRRLVACGNRNHFEVRKGNELVLDLPVTVMAIGLVCAFWVCVPLLVIGLFAGCKYSFNGKELGRDGINSVLAKASDAADRMRENTARA